MYTIPAFCGRVGLIAAAATLTAGGAAFANPSGVTYEVKVSTSFGTKFKDCFSFDTAGNLTVGDYGTITYVPGGHGTVLNKFQSVSPIAVANTEGFAIQFNGIALGDSTEGAIKGSGSDEAGDAYKFHGFPNMACTVESLPTSPYKHP